MKRLFFLVCTAVISLSVSAQKAQLVNPLVGTDEHGHTYPGVTAPFGQVQLSPDTRLNGWDGCSGYHYSDSVIYGFSHTHLSGTGCEDLCDILFTPTVHGKDWQDNTLRFRHSDEQAFAGYYKVKAFNKSWITTELAATERAGHHRYIYPAGDTMAVVIDMKHRDYTLDWNIEVRDAYHVVGYRKSKAWNEEQTIYFAAEFHDCVIKDSYLDKDNGRLYLYFGIADKHCNELTVSVGISSVDKQGASDNLQEDLSSFQQNQSKWQQYKAKSIENWEKALSVIEIQGGSKEQQRTFYTSLYHCMIAPNLYSDVDGRYRTMINNNSGNNNLIDGIVPMKPVTKADGYRRYTVFSLWDTYRAWNPLMTIIRPDLCMEFEKTFLDYYRQTNELPMWELHSWETYCMIGIHGVSVLAEWISKGICVDNELALQAMIAAANMQKLGLPFFNRDGYISSEFEHESVSKTVEFAYNMYCIAQTAKILGKADVYAEYIQKAQYYKNLFNPQNTFIQPKENGRFLPDFDPKQVDINYTEGNGWHYTFYVPQDVNSLIEMMGGDNKFEQKLDQCFNSSEATTGRNQADVTGLIGQYAHGNEPSQHTAYLYNYIGKPEKTQQLVRQILTTLYSDRPDGVCGNDDCGQMAAWYVLSSIGLYPVSPVSGEYIIGSPLFDKVIIHLPDNKKFVIKSKQGKNTPYIQSIKLNGKDYRKLYLNHSDLISGGEMEMKMISKDKLNTSKLYLYERPYSKISDYSIAVVPYFEYEGTGTFTDSLKVKVNFLNADFSLAKQLDITVDSTEKLFFYNQNRAKRSKPVTPQFYKIPKGRSIKLLTHYSPQYTAGGNNALIDQKTGTDNWRLGCWQGYWGEDVEAVIDLGKNTEISSLGGHFIQDERSWIFMPLYVEYYTSDNGKDFTFFETVANPIDERRSGIITYTFKTSKPIQSRYIKMKAINRKTNPDWHLSPGEKSWLFIDEIIIK